MILESISLWVTSFLEIPQNLDQVHQDEETQLQYLHPPCLHDGSPTENFEQFRRSHDLTRL